MDHYNMYFREKSEGDWFGFGSTFSEKGARLFMANYMTFQQEDNLPVCGVVGYIYLPEGGIYEKTVGAEDRRIVTLSIEEANDILAMEKYS